MNTSVNGLSLDELIHFYDARDRFLGLGNSIGNQDLVDGFDRLKRSRHPEAVYVTSLFPNGPPRLPSEMYHVLNGPANEGNATAICYRALGLTCSRRDLKMAARQGHVFAMSHGRKWNWTQQAAKAGDRHALHNVGVHLWDDNNFAGALSAWKQAAELGYGVSMTYYAFRGTFVDNLERCMWYGRALHVSGYSEYFMREASRYLHTRSDNRLLYAIGRMIQGHEHKILPVFSDTTTKVVALYVDCTRRARAATLCWLLVARKRNLYKDVSQLVACMVWNERHEFME